MKKQIRAAALALCTLMLFAAATGCGKQEKPTTEQPALETVEYSNLTDDDSRKQLSQLLSDAGIEEFRITALMDRVEQFNASVKSEWLTDGFESAAPTDTKYDPYEMQDEWTVANGSFPGYNCRITAFGLFSEWIAAGADQPEVQGEDSLFTDLETISANPDALCGDSTAKFCALFAPVNAVDSTEVEAQVKALRSSDSSVSPVVGASSDSGAGSVDSASSGVSGASSGALTLPDQVEGSAKKSSPSFQPSGSMASSSSSVPGIINSSSVIAFSFLPW